MISALRAKARQVVAHRRKTVGAKTPNPGNPPARPPFAQQSPLPEADTQPAC